MTDYLVEIETKYLPDLKQLYSSSDTKSYIAFTAIDQYIRCFEQDPSVKHIKIFCLNGDFSDGTFAVTDRCMAFADTCNESYDRLNRLLQLIDYSKGYTFLSVRSEVRLVIKDALQKANIDLIMDVWNLLYHLPKEEALKFNVQPPEDTDLRSVTELHDLKKANTAWPNRSPNSLPLLQRMAKYNANSGAFKKGDGTLISWVFRLPTGLLGALQTDSSYFKRGYGGLVLRDVSKKIAEIGHDIHAGVNVDNIPSRSLFEKNGFKSIGRVYWMATKIKWTSTDE